MTAAKQSKHAAPALHPRGPIARLDRHSRRGRGCPSERAAVLDKTVDIHVANEEHLLRALRKDVH
jgi:hypothetical protein